MKMINYIEKNHPNFSLYSEKEKLDAYFEFVIITAKQYQERAKELISLNGELN